MQPVVGGGVKDAVVVVVVVVTVGSGGGSQPPFWQIQPGPGWIVVQPPTIVGDEGAEVGGGGGGASKEPDGPPPDAYDVAIVDASDPKFGPLNARSNVLPLRLAATRGCRLGRELDNVFSPLNGKPREFSSIPTTVSMSRFTPTINRVPL